MRRACISIAVLAAAAPAAAAAPTVPPSPSTCRASPRRRAPSTSTSTTPAPPATATTSPPARRRRSSAATSTDTRARRCSSPPVHYVVVLHAFDASGAFIGSACQSEVFTPGQQRLRQRRADLADDRRERHRRHGQRRRRRRRRRRQRRRPRHGARPFVAQTSGVTTTLYQPWAAGNGVVYVVGAGGVILKTTDSGATWNKQIERHDAGPRGGVGHERDQTSTSPVCAAPSCTRPTAARRGRTSAAAPTTSMTCGARARPTSTSSASRAPYALDAAAASRRCRQPAG